MQENFHLALSRVRESEGGNDDDPDDPGGRTSRGITQREYDAYCRLHELSRGDVWAAPEILITRIYHDQYWYPWCDTFRPGFDYQFFDMAVLHGPMRAVILTQRALGIKDDGHIGIVTLGALAAADYPALIKAISFRRRIFLRQCRGYNKYKGGWLKRVAYVEAGALELLGKEAVT